MPKSTFRIVKGMKKEIDSIQSELGRMGGRFANLEERLEEGGRAWRSDSRRDSMHGLLLLKKGLWQ